jgi:hypothetical protein
MRPLSVETLDENFGEKFSERFGNGLAILGPQLKDGAPDGDRIVYSLPTRSRRH